MQGRRIRQSETDLNSVIRCAILVQSLIAQYKIMASITIRRLDDHLKERLRRRATRHGRSMEEEVREVLRATLATEETVPGNLAERIQARFQAAGGVDLALPAREDVREPPQF